jgi:iron complex transport system ATP-binding protein
MMLAAHDLTLAGRLAGIEAVLRPGEITAICGPNGAGKSSLLTCLAGLQAPDGGQIGLDGAQMTALSAQKRAQMIGYLPQTPEVAWDISVATLVALGRLPWGDAKVQPVTDALAALDLEDFARRPVSQLSGGERARALLARVLAGEPRWLLADEPLAALDLAHQLALLGTLHRLASVEGKGVVLVLHDLALAMNHAQRVLVLDRGRLVADGPPEQALSTAMIAQVWGVKARWLGEPGQRALLLA